MTTTHTIDVEAERVLFEARFPIMDHEILVDEDGDDYYADDATQDAWIGWLAAKRSIQPTIAAEDVRDAARIDHIAAKHVMGASYCGITSLNVIVHLDDYAKGGARYAIDCQMEREGARAIAATTTPKGEA